MKRSVPLVLWMYLLFCLKLIGVVSLMRAMSSDTLPRELYSGWLTISSYVKSCAGSGAQKRKPVSVVSQSSSVDRSHSPNRMISLKKSNQRKLINLINNTNILRNTFWCYSKEEEVWSFVHNRGVVSNDPAIRQR